MEQLHADVLAFKLKIDRVTNKPCSPMKKFNDYMGLILELKELTETAHNLNRNDIKVIFALMNRAMREI